MKNKIKIIFIGTPDFGIPSLNSLIQNQNFEVLTVITQPDKKAGRGQKIAYPPIKKEALKHNISVIQPENIKDIEQKIKKINPDIILVIAYAQLIPKSILEIPKYGCINLHASLLPKYRGSSCIQASILNGDANTGITIMKMDEGLDTGPIITQKQINVESNDTTGILFDKLSVLGSELLPKTLEDYINKKLIPQEQNHSLASFTKNIKKNDGLIDWQNSAEKIEKQIRAMSPWPGTYTLIQNNKILKIIEAEIIGINQYKIGEFFTHNKALTVQCGENALIIKQLQLEGKKPTSGEEFLNGHKEIIIQK